MATTAKASDKTIKGDNNLDGNVTATDIMILKWHIIDIKALNGKALQNADVNEDGYVNSTDLIQLKQYLVGIINWEKKDEPTQSPTPEQTPIQTAEPSTTPIQTPESTPIAKGTRLVDMFKNGELHIGDYVAYQPANTNETVELNKEQTGVEGKQVYKYDSSTTWRVLGLEGAGESEHIILISGSPLKKDLLDSTGGKTDETVDPYLHLSGAEAYAWTNDEYVKNPGIDISENILDSISRIYANDTLASDVRSIRIEDINNLLDLKVVGTNLYKKTDTSNQNNLMYNQSIGNRYAFRSGSYVLENYLKEMYPARFEGLIMKNLDDEIISTFYSYSYESLEIIDNTSKLYELLFKDTEMNENNFETGPKAYWLATTNTGSDGRFHYNYGIGHVAHGFVYNTFDMFNNAGGVHGLEYGVRPIVSLKPEITDVQISVITGSEPEWSTTCGHWSYGDATKGQI